MVGFDKEQRLLISEKIGDVANLMFGALVVGQTLSGRPFSFLAAVTGIILWVACIGIAAKLRRERS